MRLFVAGAAIVALVTASCGQISGLDDLGVCSGAACPDAGSNGGDDASGGDSASGRDASGDAASTCQRCGTTNSCCFPRVCAANVCCGLAGSPCNDTNGSLPCCGPQVCNGARVCAVVCSARGVTCNATADCCFGNYCPTGGGKCTACLDTREPCTEDFQCCSGKCAASKCADAG